MRRAALPWTAGVAVVTLAAAGGGLSAQEPAADGWSDTAEFSFVATAGNSETQTLGFKNKLWRKWDAASFELSAGGVRAESERVSRFALGTATSYVVVENSTSEVAAENYFLSGRYDRKMSDRFFWFGGAGWDRNRPAGVDNRYVGSGGVGHLWFDREELKLRSDYSLTWTKQDDVIEDPAFDDTFLGLRVSWSYLDKLGSATTYTHDTILDANLEEGDDWRGNMTNSVAVAMNSRLALKVSLQWLYDNSPAVAQIDLFAAAAPPPASATGSVLVELDELDTIFTSSLVINF